MTETKVISQAKRILANEGKLSFKESALELESIRTQLLILRCRLQRRYYQAREKLRVPKDKEYTDFDRNTMLDAYSAEVREKYELVKGLEELVKERVELIKILLGAK